MNENKVIDSLATEIVRELRLPENLCTPFIKERLQWAYVAGHEEGRKFMSHRKSVVQLTLEGSFVKEWPSPTYAAKAFGVHRNTISKVAAGQEHHNTAVGFKWEYSKDYYKRLEEERLKEIEKIFPSKSL